MNFFEIAKGTVESVDDPETNGRVKVRLDGYHTQLVADTGSYGITIEDLDWVPVMMPSTSSSRNGKGNSPSGLLRGDRVVVMILDEYIQSMLIIGTIHGEGDVSDLSVGGIEGLESISVDDHNNYLINAPRLDSREYDRDVIEDDDVGYARFMEALVFDEGFVNKPYYDQFKYPTIGIGTLLIKQRHYSLAKAWDIAEKRLGRKIPERKISYDDAMKLAENDIRKIKSEIGRFSLLSNAYNSVSQTRKYGLISMCYQMGTGGVAKFNRSLNAIINEEWEDAYRFMMDSLWARQTPSRASRVASIIRDNNFGQYPKGVADSGKSRQFSPMMFSAKANDEPEKGGAFDDIINGIGNIGETVGDVTGILGEIGDLLGGMTGGMISFPDFNSVQVQVIESTKALRRIKGINSMSDIVDLIKGMIGYDSFIESVRNEFENLEDKAKTLRDINIMEFIQKYLDRFKSILEKLVDDAIEYVKNTVSNAKKELELLVALLKKLFKRIGFSFDNIWSDIEEFIAKISDLVSKKEEDEKESGTLFSEPPSEYASEYPYLKTEISDSGHIREVDDTPGFERIKERHRSGTYREINADGRKVEKTVSDNYAFVKGDEHLYVEGTGKIFIGGSMMVHIMGNSKQVIYGDCEQVIRGDSKIEVAGNSEVLTIGNSKTEIKGNVELLVKGNVKGTIEGETNLILTKNGVIEAKTDLELKVLGNMNSTIEGTGSFLAKGELNLNSDSVVNVGGPRINFIRR